MLLAIPGLSGRKTECGFVGAHRGIGLNQFYGLNHPEMDRRGLPRGRGSAQEKNSRVRGANCAFDEWVRVEF